MNFLKEIRAHLASFETEATAEIHKFIDYLETKYQQPQPAVVVAPTVTMPAPTNPAPTTCAPTTVPAAAPVAPAEPEATTEAPTEGEENGN
jgi:hypothetical protein